MVTNPPSWLVELVSNRQKAEDDLKLGADDENDDDSLEINKGPLHE
jgi:hypothetical protein